MDNRISSRLTVAILLAFGALACLAPAGELKDIPRGFKLVAQDNCGVKGQASNLLIGASFTLPESNRPALKDERLFSSARSGAYSANREANVVILRYTGLWPDARYAARVLYYNPLSNECVQTPLANARPLASAPTRLPPGVPLTQVFEVPRELYQRSATLDLEFRLRSGPCAQVSAVELWSNRTGLMEGRRGPFIRFRVPAMPPDGQPFKIRCHEWGPLTTVSNVGLTAWIPKFHLTLWLFALPTNIAGSMLFSYFAPKDPAVDIYLQQFPWHAECPGGFSVFGAANMRMIYTQRDVARLDYQLTLAQVGEKLWPLARPPLLFGNSLCDTLGPRTDYHAKNLRLLGMNCVTIGGNPGVARRMWGSNDWTALPDQGKLARLYGWSVFGGEPYWFGKPHNQPFRLPLDVAATRAYQEGWYSNDFFKDFGPELVLYRLSEINGEQKLKPDDPQALAGFRAWLAGEKVPPKELGAKSMDEVTLVLKDPQGADDTPANRRRYYWSRRYQAWLTPQGWALAAAAMKRRAVNPEFRAYVGPGDALYTGRNNQSVVPMPLDLFALAGYPELMPSLGNSMSPALGGRGENERYLTHETLAYTVAFYNSGARQYGADFGKPPLSRAMMKCYWPSLFRAYTMLGNQVKHIAYPDFGPQMHPDTTGTDHPWAGRPLAHHAVGQVNNQAALADDLLGPGILRPSRVALLYARASDYYAVAMKDPVFGSRRALFLALAHDYYKPELVTEEQVAAGALEHYDALYVADPWVAKKAQERIAAWVKKGGLLWACDGALRFDEYREPCDLLADAGLKRNWITAVTNAPVKGASNPPPAELTLAPAPGEADFEAHTAFTARHEGQSIRPCFPPQTDIFFARLWGCRGAEWSGARVRARYSDGTPAWLENKLGKGRVIYVAHDAGAEYALRREPQTNYSDLTFWRDPGATACRAVLTAPLREAKVPRPLEVSVPALMASPVGTEAGTVVVLYNMIAATNENVVFTLPAPGQPHSVQVIRGGPREPEIWSHTSAAWERGGRVLRGGASAPEDLPYEYAAGAVKMTLPKLPGPGDGCLLVVRHKPPPPDPRLEQMRKNAEANLASDDWEALSAGAWFAGFFPDWNLAAKLPPLLKHEHWAVRRSAAESLGRLKYAAAGGELRKAIDGEKDAHVLADMLIALDRLEHPDVPALAEKLVLHDNPVVYDEAGAILLRRGL